MDITKEEIRQIVHEELDEKLVNFMEKVDESIKSRIQHLDPSPKTKEEIEIIKQALKKQDEKWDDMRDLVFDVKDIKKSIEGMDLYIKNTEKWKTDNNEWRVVHDVKAGIVETSVKDIRDTIKRLAWIVITAVILAVIALIFK